MRREARRKHEKLGNAKSEVTEKVFGESSISKHKEVSDIEGAKHFKCTEFELFLKTEKGMKSHIGKSHKSKTLSTLEKERRAPSMNMSLALSPILQKQYNGESICSDPLVMHYCILVLQYYILVMQ